ncbi:MAG TPA: hypothetical protein PLZ15_08035 [Melioribacteraceae bacterium]|nr:hypothetical protein [Melioribacteraceae bacterium]
MVLDLIIIDTGDGFSSDIPSIKGCDSWAHSEDDAISKTLDLLRFYIQVDSAIKIKTDLARKEGNTKIYKVIFDK